MDPPLRTCSKIDVNDIKSIASAPCKTDCQRTIETYCCCGDDTNPKLCRSDMQGRPVEFGGP
ncbi:hypothetical protein Tco_1116344, partial [Tanacetum coccineum]